ncbi:hypothetical protein GL50803_00137755 [Giardia duodenalis]|uniref:Uncharacterized protein n=1 Tax=Giardia intestinalis (strain ATCC 50803 / WB clone C6) TaxID=184922 RepID=A8BI07_GIAIC|nr:hypothetical protein GL50803_00137755 [Giardia intestinalis]KAE8302607.1 hypothetical protein GL50803_00137755 [Giardia intestinalis]|eukprot:XP_001706957.1 Hypothetical protein GL50803_137755 [Giardia lamblia ATCC 50803]
MGPGTLQLALLSMILASHSTEGVYNIKDMEPISLDIDSTATIRYTYTPVHNSSPLLCVNLTSYAKTSTVSVSVGRIPLLLTTGSNMTAIPLETVASLIQLSESSTPSVIDFTVQATMPTTINFTAGLFRQLIYGKSITIAGNARASERVLALANDGLHDILLTFSDGDKTPANAPPTCFIDLHSQPFATKRESLANPTTLLIRSVGNTYQYVAATNDQEDHLTLPKRLFMESSFYYLTVNLHDELSSLTISYVERYQRFTPDLQIDYYNVPIHYTVDISDYRAGTQILIGSTCLDAERIPYSSIRICLRYNILSVACSLILQNTLRYAWMTVQEVTPPGYLSSIYVSDLSSFAGYQASTSAEIYNLKSAGSCKIFLTNVNFITGATETLSFVNKNNRNKATLLIIENPGWIDDELVVVITLRPFYEVSIPNFHPYVQFFLSTTLVYPNETHNSLAYVMNFPHLSGVNYAGSSVIPTYLEAITNKSAVLRIRPEDFSVQPDTGSIYIKLEHSVDLDLLILNAAKPAPLRPGLLYGTESNPLSALNLYYIDSGHTTGVSTLSGYIYFDVCNTSLFLSNQSNKKPIKLRLTDNMDHSGINFLDMLVPITEAMVYAPVYSSYATFVRILDTEYVSPSAISYKIGYLTRFAGIIIGDSRVRIHTGLMSDIIEVDSAKAPAQRYTAYTGEAGIHIAYAVYLVPCASVAEVRQAYPMVPISRCGLEGALEHTPSVQDMDTSNVVYRVSEWVVAPAADNTEIYTPEFIEQANNTWSMLRIPVDLPSYKHEPYYLVVVAAVDTAASNLTNQPIVDPIWGHTIDRTTIQFYETRYLSSSFSGEEFISFVGYHSKMSIALIVVFWSVATLILLLFITVLSLFLKYRYKYTLASKRAKAVQLVNRELSIEYGPSRLGSSDLKQKTRRGQAGNGQIDQAYSSMDNMSSHSLPLLQSYSPSQSGGRHVAIPDFSHPFSKDLSSQDSILDRQDRAKRNRRQ